jgi:hypothetical protein
MWRNLKRQAWHRPLSVGIAIWGSAVFFGALMVGIADAMHHKDLGEYALGLMVGTLSQRFAVFARWRRIDRYRQYAAKQESIPVRRGPHR